MRGNRLSEKAYGVNFVNRYKAGASARELTWLLTDEEAATLAKAACAYCGSLPKNNARLGKRLFNGIDRKNNGEGYTSSNSVTCCGICNRAKRDMEESAFIEWLRQVAKHFNNRVAD
jgi:hypothetical protein